MNDKVPQSAPESYQDLTFPVEGLDLRAAYGLQRYGSTPTGANVRGFEPSAMRLRGGARSGLSKLVEDTVNGAHVIQHLNVVVDPQGPATADDQDLFSEDDLIDDPSTNNGLVRRIPVGRRVRRGGSGHSPGRNKSPRTSLKGPFAATAADGTPPQVMTLDVTVGQILVAAVGSHSDSDATFTLSDDQGVEWHQTGITSISNSDPTPIHITVSLWWRYVSTSGTITITATSSNDNVSVKIATLYTADSFLNVIPCNASQPDITQTAISSASPANITVSTRRAGEMLVIASLADSGAFAIPPLAGNATTIANLSYYPNYNRSVTGYTWSGLPTARFIAMVGTTFLPRTDSGPPASADGVGTVSPGSGIAGLGNGGAGTGKVTFAASAPHGLGS